MKKIILLALAIALGNATELNLYKSQNCGCCSKWAQIVSKNGFEVKTINSENMEIIKSSLKVPFALQSCHTAVVNGYVIEGHVPVQEIKNLLKNKPDIIGISVPGMPSESQGMEQGGIAQKYNVVSFDKNGNNKVIATYIGSKKIN